VEYAAGIFHSYANDPNGRNIIKGLSQKMRQPLFASFCPEKGTEKKPLPFSV
jgi:hypothetical protein